MSTELQIHPVQANILIALLFKPVARFSDLNTLNISNDHFAFHLKKLTKLGIVRKTKNKYQLTKKGKEFANRFDTENAVIERQAKVGVLVCCVKKHKGRYKYLVQQRLKEPYYGFYGFLTGKVRWGDTVEETAKRELKEETGLTGTMKFLGVKHKMDYEKESSLLEDKFFFVFKATNTKGELIKEYEGGKNIWLTEGEINKLPDLFDAVDESVFMIKKGGFHFSETKYKVRGY